MDEQLILSAELNRSMNHIDQSDFACPIAVILILIENMPRAIRRVTHFVDDDCPNNISRLILISPMVKTIDVIAIFKMMFWFFAVCLSYAKMCNELLLLNRLMRSTDNQQVLFMMTIKNSGDDKTHMLFVTEWRSMHTVALDVPFMIYCENPSNDPRYVHDQTFSALASLLY